MSKLSNSLNLLQQMSDGWSESDNGHADSPSFEISSTESHTSRGADRPTLVLQLSQIIVANRIRQHLNTERTESLAHSIRQHGFRGVLWVRQVRGQYHLIAGGRRYAACQMAGIESVSVEVWKISDAEAIQLELLENFQREDLNAIEEAEGVLRMLEVTLELGRSQVIALLNRMARAGNGSTKSSANNVVRNTIEPDEEELYQQVEEVFRVIGRYSPGSFRAHRLPLLNLPDSLIAAVSNGSLEYTKAQVLGRVKDEAARDKLLGQVLREDLSYSQVSELVRQVQAESNQSTPVSSEQEFRIRSTAVFKQLKNARLAGRQLKKAEKLLAQLEEILKDE